jgi:hypothetical protein
VRRVILLATMFLSACAPAAQAIQTAIAQTEASWTATPPPAATIATETVTVVATSTLEATPAPTRPQYNGVPLWTKQEAIQTILQQGSMKDEDRVRSDAQFRKLLDVVYVRDPNGGDPPWIISYKGIYEKPSEEMQYEPFIATPLWYGNLLMIDGKKVGTTLIAVITTKSGHSIVIFRDTLGNRQVLVLDSVFYPTFER